MANEGRKLYLITRASQLMEELDKLEYIEHKYGSDEDYETGCVLSFNVRYHEGGIAYTFVALKVKSNMWYVTSQYDGRLTFEQLVDKYLSKTDQVFFVSEWKELQ